MKIIRTSDKRQCGLSLVVTLVIATGVCVLVSGVLYYTSTNTRLTRRISQYDGSVAAAVAATEKVVTRISKDFQAAGDSAVANNLLTYRGLVPTDQEVSDSINLLKALLGPSTSPSPSSSPLWTKYEFANPQGQVNQTHVERVADWAFRDLQTKFTGLKGYAANYSIISNAREVNRPYDIVSAVKQDVQVASIPLCQYQLYYVPDLELHPSTASIRLNGRVHGNSNIYVQPGIDLLFESHVTAARKILHQKHPADPVVRTPGKITYRAERENGVNTLNLPIGPSATPTVLREIVEAPTTAESATSLLAQQRLYNKAELIITVTNSTVVGRSGGYNGGAVTVPWLGSRGIVTRNAVGFYDARQCDDVQLTEFDLAKFLLNYDELTTLLGRPVKVLWIQDLGGNSAPPDPVTLLPNGKVKKPKKKDLATTIGLNPTNALTGVRVLNAQTLPSLGLTIATPDPLYVRGNFNLNGVPACLAADAITILSGNWVDAKGSTNLPYRVATDTTVNAAIITGIVPTGSGAYSGGAENALRFLENWSGKTFTFSGSIAVLYFSEYAQAPWGGPNVYSPPNRNWSYDPKLSQAATTPPGMPAARAIFRSDWTLIRPYSKL